jgi:uncharacterized protein with ParB-like and HNH nuclease domain
MFTPDQKSINELFIESVEYTIPDYQRPYSWESIGKTNKNNQVNAMWDDLFEYFESGDKNPYFFGSILLVGSDNDKNFKVIDGQQRLTTLILLFAAIKCFIKNVNVDSIEVSSYLPKAESSLDLLIFNEDYTGFIASRKLKIARNMGFDYDSILERAVKCDVLDSIPQVKVNIEQKKIIDRYFKNRDFFIEKLNEKFTIPATNILTLEYFMRLNDFIKTLQRKIRIVRIIADSEDIAFKIFEILNNRGLPLSNKDLFRNFFINQYTILKQSDEHRYKNLDINEKWYGLENSDYFNEEFLGRFVESSQGSQQKSSAFNDLKKIYENNIDVTIEYSKIEILHHQLSEYLTYYEILSNFELIEDKEIRYRVAFLMNAGNERYAINLLLALFKHFQYKGEENEKINRFLINYERYIINTLLRPNLRFSNQYIYQTISFLNQNEFEKAFLVFDNFNDYENGNYFYLNTQDLDNDTAKLLLSKYLWYQERKSEQDVVSQVYRFKDATLEHIIPQNPEKETNWTTDFSDDFRKKFTYKLGNMTLLTKSMNSSAKNRDYNIKLNTYRKTVLPLTKDLPNTIDEDFIKKRHEIIINEILEDLKY